MERFKTRNLFLSNQDMKQIEINRPLFFLGASDLLDFSGLEATGTDTDRFYGTVNIGPDGLKIGIPTPRRYVMSVGNIMPEGGFFPANFTNFCHFQFSKIIKLIIIYLFPKKARGN